jgi:hypothetical protein
MICSDVCVTAFVLVFCVLGFVLCAWYIVMMRTAAQLCEAAASATLHDLYPGGAHDAAVSGQVCKVACSQHAARTAIV